MKPNRYKRIPLTNGGFAVLDSADYRRLCEYEWRLSQNKHNKYAYRMEKCRKVYMHREIALGHQINLGRSVCVDHINHDSLDNRRMNLRISSYSQNHANRRIFKLPMSGYPGVYPSAIYKWRSRIRVNKKHVELGSFDTPQEAFAVFRRAHINLYGEFSIYANMGGTNELHA